MNTYVISVGGSAIIPNEIDVKFLRQLRDAVNRLKRNYKLVIVCGGGRTARKYIDVLRKDGVSESLSCLAGITSTKLNATLLSLFLRAGIIIPDSIKEVRSLLRKQNVVVCGALGFQPNMTSDGDAAQIAVALKAKAFINLTDVDGLYTKDPKKHKDAKFITDISRNDFWKIASSIKFTAGQHFVLDQSAAEILRKKPIRTVIVKGVDNVENVILGRPFTGTVIE